MKYHLMILLMSGIVSARTPHSTCKILEICGCCSESNGLLLCSGVMLGPYAPEFTGVSSNDTVWSADFTQNEITILQNMSYYASYDDVIYFSKVDYSNNYIYHIDSMAFRGQESSLRVIKLNDNNLKVLAPDVLTNLTALETLEISNNQLAYMDALCALTSSPLYQLDLSNNSITEIPISCLKETRIGLTPESHLDLSNNKMVLWTDTEMAQRNLGLYNLTANNWVCICCHSWMGKLDPQVMCMDMDSKSWILVTEYSTREECDQTQIQCDGKNLQLQGKVHVDKGDNSTILIGWTTSDNVTIGTQRQVQIIVYSLNTVNISLCNKVELTANHEDQHNNTVNITQSSQSLNGSRLIACISMMDISVDNMTLVTCNEVPFIIEPSDAKTGRLVSGAGSSTFKIYWIILLALTFSFHAGL